MRADALTPAPSPPGDYQAGDARADEKQRRDETPQGGGEYLNRLYCVLHLGASVGVGCGLRAGLRVCLRDEVLHCQQKQKQHGKVKQGDEGARRCAPSPPAALVDDDVAVVCHFAPYRLPSGQIPMHTFTEWSSMTMGAAAGAAGRSM